MDKILTPELRDRIGTLDDLISDAYLLDDFPRDFFALQRAEIIANDMDAAAPLDLCCKLWISMQLHKRKVDVKKVPRLKLSAITHAFVFPGPHARIRTDKTDEWLNDRLNDLAEEYIEHGYGRPDAKAHANAEQMLEEYGSYGLGLDSELEDLAQCRYAVVIYMGDHKNHYVSGAKDKQGVADIILGCRLSDGEDVEYTGEIMDLWTGEYVRFDINELFMIEMRDGNEQYYSVNREDNSWLHDCIRNEMLLHFPELEQQGGQLVAAVDSAVKRAMRRRS